MDVYLLNNMTNDMKQHNQIGKYTRKDEVLNAKVGKTFVTPENKKYTFDYRKEGRRYIFIIGYNGYNMQVTEAVYNLHSIDVLINAMQKEI